jgi:hypothetical protein
MEDLIKALQILLKYGNPDNPTNCVHDELWICGINPDIVSDDDIQKLDELGFFVSNEFGEDNKQFKNYKYGSA